jgi:hypothetical protein
VANKYVAPAAGGAAGGVNLGAGKSNFFFKAS